MMNIVELRRDIKARRSQLTLQQQSKISKEIISKILSQTWFQSSQTIAFYLAVNGEVDTNALIERAWEFGKTCYLPVLHPLKHNSLWFVPHQANQPLIKNKFGILEPQITANSQIIPPWALNLVFLPLVAFDQNCNRVGMGGGYYDRTFEFTKQDNPPKPQMVGLGYEFQKVSHLSPNSWDVQMNAVVTESCIYNNTINIRSS